MSHTRTLTRSSQGKRELAFGVSLTSLVIFILGSLMLLGTANAQPVDVEETQINDLPEPQPEWYLEMQNAHNAGELANDYRDLAIVIDEDYGSDEESLYLRMKLESKALRLRKTPIETYVNRIRYYLKLQLVWATAQEILYEHLRGGATVRSNPVAQQADECKAEATRYIVELISNLQDLDTRRGEYSHDDLNRRAYQIVHFSREIGLCATELDRTLIHESRTRTYFSSD